MFRWRAAIFSSAAMYVGAWDRSPSPRSARLPPTTPFKPPSRASLYILRLLLWTRTHLLTCACAFIHIFTRPRSLHHAHASHTLPLTHPFISRPCVSPPPCQMTRDRRCVKAPHARLAFCHPLPHSATDTPVCDTYLPQTQMARDRRCGKCGPILIDTIQAEAKGKNVRVRGCSHGMGKSLQDCCFFVVLFLFFVIGDV